MTQYIGRLLDNRYEILEQLGTGGMAVVYKALCHRLNRLVAIKILKDEFSGDDEFRRRFRAEGEAVAMLSHPNIVQVYDVVSADDCNFIVMELIDGISLNEYIQSKGILNWKETLHFSMQIAQGLEHAHSRGIVHRDIKPHNVMVLKNGSVKVMDFGIARVMTKSNTLTKEALGSVHYISPEQAKGGLTDNRSDIYSLSVVMYEMMAGRPPFDGESPVAVAIQHINGGAPRPSTYNPNIPIGLEQIIMKGMALNVNDRYATASDMLRDMEEFRKNPAIEFDYTPANGTVDRLKKFPDPVKPKNTAQKIAKAKGGTVTPPRPNHTASTDSMKVNVSQPQSTDAIRRAQQRRQEEQHRKAERSRMAAAAVIICSVVAVIAIVVFLVAVFNGALLNRDRELTDVPNLVGQVYTDSLISKYNNLNIRVGRQEYSEEYESGIIMKQEPMGGQVMKGSELFITVSLGPETKNPAMENLIGIDEIQAKNYLNEKGYEIITHYEANNVYNEHQVFRTDPAYGGELKPGQTVYLWVSSGPQTATMVSVVGMDEAAAVALLESLGFTNVQTNAVYSSKPEGTVVFQPFKKGTDIGLTAEIILEVSKGPEPTVPDATEPEATQPSATQPDVPMLTNPTEPTQAPTVRFRFTLPVREQQYTLTIRTQNGSELVAGPVAVSPGTDGISVELAGSGTQKYDLFIDGVFYQTQEAKLS